MHNILRYSKNPKKFTIYSQVAIGLVLIIVFLSTGFLLWNTYKITCAEKARIQKTADTYVDTIANALEVPLWDVDRRNIDVICNFYLKNDNINRVKLVGESGEVFFDARAGNKGTTDSKTLMRTKRIIHQNEFLGKVTLEIATTQARMLTRHLVRSVVITLFVFVLTVVVLWLMRGRVQVAAELAEANMHLAEAKERAEIESTKAVSATEAKSMFLANMSHEIRTPLNAVMGLTDLVLRTELTTTQQQYLTKIKASGQTLLAVINDILDFSKIEAGHLELEHIPFSLFDVIANISEMFGFKAHEKNLELLVSIDDHTPSALIGDPVRLGQILINLVGNAFKFTQTGEIIVHVKSLNDPVSAKESEHIILEFSVQDTGAGIPEDRLDILFDSFSQVDSSTTRKYGGTGLGLSICRKLTQLMGGEIRVSSEQGKGSTFTFTICVDKQPEKNQISLHPPRDLRGLRVLIVDDNQTSLDVLAGVVTSFQMEAVTVPSGQKAVEILEKAPAPFDLVLVDWKMPGLNGIETAKKIKQHQKLERIPIVCMVSAYVREDLIRRADKQFLDAFLHKPVNQSLLFDTIMELFGRYDATVSQRSTQASADHDLDKSLQGYRILLVEDNTINQEVALEWLHIAGLQTAVASNGKEALEYLEKNVPDAVLMDIQMPEMDGMEATRRIRADKRYADLPVIAMTAHALKGDREKCLEAGMNDHITKPIDPQHLFATLAHWLDTSRSQDIGDEPVKKETSMLKKMDTPLPPSTFNVLETELPGIEVQAGLARVNHNEALYVKLLKSFFLDYREAPEHIRHHLESKEVDDAGRVVHSIKGVAANLGAQDLSTAAEVAERQINSDSEIEEETWDELVGCLDKVMDSLSRLFASPMTDKSRKSQDTTPARVDEIDALDVPLCLERLQGAASLLDDDLEGARQALDTIEPMLRHLVPDKMCDKLTAHIDNFEIDEALQVLRAMENMLEKM
jgi:signal transduction histidine kinase/CheY-like chemotaxis protein/HPt (histidine-containing phosphotransfer) domain-containing protein